MADFAPHGTRARYENRRAPCRCQACRLANTLYQRSYRGSGPRGQLHLFEVIP
jgi:hypothetical protein